MRSSEDRKAKGTEVKIGEHDDDEITMETLVAELQKTTKFIKQLKTHVQHLYYLWPLIVYVAVIASVMLIKVIFWS